MTSEREIAFNCWYVHDDLGLIYSLRARAYVASGTNEEKMRMLQSCATTDYLIARAFPLPPGYATRFVGSSGTETTMAVMQAASLETNGGPIPVAQVFDEALKALEAEIPAQTRLKVPDRPLVCVTPLLGDDQWNIRPSFRGTRRTV